MKLPSFILGVAGATLAVALGGCGDRDSHERIADDIAIQMDRIAISLSSVTDKASAEKSVSDMKSIVGEMKKLAARAQALSQPSAARKAKLDAKMKSKAADLQRMMEGSQATLMKAGPEAAGIIVKGMLGLAPELDQMSDLFSEAEKNQ